MPLARLRCEYSTPSRAIARRVTNRSRSFRHWNKWWIRRRRRASLRASNYCSRRLRICPMAACPSLITSSVKMATIIAVVTTPTSPTVSSTRVSNSSQSTSNVSSTWSTSWRKACPFSSCVCTRSLSSPSQTQMQLQAPHPTLSQSGKSSLSSLYQISFCIPLSLLSTKFPTDFFLNKQRNKKNHLHDDLNLAMGNLINYFNQFQKYYVSNKRIYSYINISFI